MKTALPPLFAALLDEAGLPRPEPEYRFHPTRRWRFDFCWPAQKVALEIEGGVWKQGRHNRPKGFLKDIIKYNAAAILGWRILRVTPAQFAAGVCVVEMLREALR